MNESPIEFQELDYGDVRKADGLFYVSVPELSNLSIGLRSTSATTSNIHVQPLIAPYQTQIVILKKDEKTIKMSEISQPFPVVSLEEFVAKHLSSSEQQLMWEDFRKDLWEEVVNKKISRIKYYRIIHKLTQKQLAKKLNTQQPNIARLEKLGYTPDISILRKLGKVFSIDYKELL